MKEEPTQTSFLPSCRSAKAKDRRQPGCRRLLPSALSGRTRTGIDGLGVLDRPQEMDALELLALNRQATGLPARRNDELVPFLLATALDLERLGLQIDALDQRRQTQVNIEGRRRVLLKGTERDLARVGDEGLAELCTVDRWVGLRSLSSR
jgi:hypothetical protein